MSDPEHILQTDSNVTAAARGKFLQWNIATLLLLMAAVGVWTSYFRMVSEAKRMTAELESLIRLARELMIDDSTQYAIVERHEQWHDDHSWEVHLPEGSRYRLKLATRQIGMKFAVRRVVTDNLPETDHSVELTSGRHVISLEKRYSIEEPYARVLVDGKPGVESRESTEWKPQGGSTWGGSFKQSTQQPTDQPLELIRIRFQVRRPNGTTGLPTEPHNGIVVWIERKK
ncbi:MAG: hypothetical protein H8E66_29865 [Planctomycetes bacterium]|nr:hypothetical protein [Planctomycetota bacterium]